MAAVALGIDVGTGSTKVGLIGEDGALLAVGRGSHVIAEPRQGWSETNPAVWIDALIEATGQALNAASAANGGTHHEVVAIGFSGQMHGVVMCDAAVTPLRPAVLWSDQRSQPYLAELRESAEAAGHPRVGNPLVAGMAGSTLAAIARQEPDVFANIATVLQVKDWVRHWLTGTLATDASDASATLLWDPQADAWSAIACDLYGVDPGWLAPVRGSGEQAGTLTAEAAAALGLSASAGIPVATGAGDTAAALVGAAIQPDETQVSTGTGGQIATLLSVPVIDETERTHLYRAAHDQRWYAMAAIQNAGIAIDWALGLLNIDIEQAGQAVRNTSPGSNGIHFLPYLTGERTPHLDSSLTGVWSGLRSSATIDDMVRSVFEGVAFAMRDGLDALRDAGHVIDVALLAGGGSTATWWRQMLADVLDIGLVPHDAADASVRGAGLLGWSAIGHAVDPGRAVNRLAPTEPGVASAAYAEARDGFRAVGATQTGAAYGPY